MGRELRQNNLFFRFGILEVRTGYFRYRETQGDYPSEGQINKLAQIQRKIEHTNYNHPSADRDAAEIAFLRRREGDLLFKHGFSHDASTNLDHSRQQVQKSFEHIERQLRQEREQTNQRGLGI